jgi:prophage regulatory protein
MTTNNHPSELANDTDGPLSTETASKMMKHSRAFIKLLGKDKCHYRTFDDVIQSDGTKRKEATLARKFSGPLNQCAKSLHELNGNRKALRVKDVCAKTGLSKTHIYRLIQRGQFPKSVYISERIRVWDEAAVDAWLAEKFGGGCHG